MHWTVKEKRSNSSIMLKTQQDYSKQRKLSKRWAKEIE
jgi:hypothetical protein